MNETTSKYNKKVAVKALFAVLIAYLVGTILKFKVPPIAMILSDSLNLSIAQNGWLMSILAIGYLIMAIPTASIINRLGTRNTTVLGAALSLLGTLLGVFAFNFEALLATRFIEGIGMGIIMVVAFSVVAEFFPPEKRGLPNGLISGCYVVSYFLMMNIALPIADAATWVGVWWFGVAVSVIAVVVAWTLMPKKGHSFGYVEEGVVAESPNEKVNIAALLKNPTIWILPFVFVVFNIGYQGIITYMPTYLVEVVGAETSIANFATSLNALVGFPAALIAGLYLNKAAAKNRKWLPAIVMLVVAVCYFFAFRMPTVMSAAFLLVAVGFLTSLVPPCLFTMGPDALPKAAYAATIVAIVTFGQNLGMVLGPIAVGYMVELSGSWSAVAMPTAILAAIGGIALFFTKAADSKEDKQAAASKN